MKNRFEVSHEMKFQTALDAARSELYRNGPRLTSGLAKAAATLERILTAEDLKDMIAGENSAYADVADYMPVLGGRLWVAHARFEAHAFKKDVPYASFQTLPHFCENPAHAEAGCACIKFFGSARGIALLAEYLASVDYDDPVNDMLETLSEVSEPDLFKVVSGLLQKEYGPGIPHPKEAEWV